jgi:hypothetical protein
MTAPTQLYRVMLLGPGALAILERNQARHVDVYAESWWEARTIGAKKLALRTWAGVPIVIVKAPDPGDAVLLCAPITPAAARKGPRR